MIAFVEPPIARSTRSAFSTERSVMIWLGRSRDAASATASRPLASAARSRSAWTAGIAAVPRGAPGACSLRAGRTHHVAGPRGRRQVLLDAPDLARAHAAGAVLGPEAPAVGARAEPLAAVGHRHHRPGQELHGRHVGRRGTHE